jgi:hypothetical protein
MKCIHPPDVTGTHLAFLALMPTTRSRNRSVVLDCRRSESIDWLGAEI